MYPFLPPLSDYKSGWVRGEGKACPKESVQLYHFDLIKLLNPEENNF